MADEIYNFLLSNPPPPSNGQNTIQNTMPENNMQGYSPEGFSHLFNQAMSLNPDLSPVSIPNSRHSDGSGFSNSPSMPSDGTSLFDFNHEPFESRECPMPSHAPYDPTEFRRPPPSQLMRRTKVEFTFCVFCKNNGEDEAFYLNHTLKDDAGYVRCPVLWKYRCPICGATGAVSHTIKYCPQNRGGELTDYAPISMLKQLRPSVGNRSIMPMAPPVIPPSRRPMRNGLIGMSGPNSAWTGPTSFPNSRIDGTNWGLDPNSPTLHSYGASNYDFSPDTFESKEPMPGRFV